MMKREQKYLRARAFESAACYVRKQARPLELARFNCLFNGEDVEDVLSELEKFQNADGGFGNALEPDVRAPQSSAICTSLAFQIMRFHQVSKDEKIVRRGMDYLMLTLNFSGLYWRIIPEIAEDYPHAPWWNQTGRDPGYDAFSLNPTAEILGYLLDYREWVIDDAIIPQITDRVLQTLESLKELEMHDLMCCLRLLETKNLAASVRESILHELKRLVTDTVATNPEQWTDYCLRPLQIAPSPDSPFIDDLKEAVSLNLDFEIEEQSDDGSWSPTWSWADQYLETWKTAKREWSGVLTLDKLLLLDRFYRIEGK